MQDLSLAPSDNRSISPVAHDQSNASSAVGESGLSLDGDNSFDPALPLAQASAGDDNFGERTPAAISVQGGPLSNVLSPSAPMNLFSPTVGSEDVVSPSAASSYAEAAEALGQGATATSQLPSPSIPLASGNIEANDSYSAEPEEQQLDGVLDESLGGAR